MENTATVEQAEPQGSAAPGVAATAPDTSPSPSPQRSASALSRMRNAVEARTGQSAAQAAATSQETSAADEQPASPSSPARDTEARETGSAQPSDSTQQPKLSRAERKALKTAQPDAAPAAPPAPAPPAVTSGTAPAQQEATPAPPTDPIERVERTLSDAIARIEARLPAPEQSAPAAPAQSAEDTAYFGDDAEFVRRATIATRPNQTGEWLTPEQANELEVWSLRREARERTSQSAEQAYKVAQSQIVLGAAEAHGIDQQALYSAPSMRAIYDTFVDRGRALEREAVSAELATSAAENARLKQINQQLSDDLEALENRLPGFARPLLSGGMSGNARAAQIADLARLSGRERMRIGLSSPPRKARPGAR